MSLSRTHILHGLTAKIVIILDGMPLYAWMDFLHFVSDLNIALPRPNLESFVATMAQHVYNTVPIYILPFSLFYASGIFRW